MDENNDLYPRVLQVVPAMNQGGVEHATLDIARGLYDVSSHTPHFVASNGGELVQKLPQNTHPITLPLHTKNPFRIVWNAVRLMHCIKTHNIHVVHARSRAPGWSAYIACRILNIPLITTYHGAHTHTYKWRIVSYFKKLYNSVMARGDAVIAVSKFMQHHIESLYPASKKHIVPIQEGIDTDYFTRKYPAPENPLSIFCPSRMSNVKGIDILLKAFARVVRDHGPSVTLMLMRTGKKTYIEIIDQMIADLKLAPYIEWQDSTSDLRPLYERASIVVVPSRVPEALGRVSLEALSMQTLLIATNMGATASICLHNQTGFLVKPDNSGDLYQAIQHALNLAPADAETLKNAGRHHIQTHFSKAQMIQKTCELYKSFYPQKGVSS